MEKTTAGYAVKVVGLAPAAARHGGFSAETVTWATLLASGGLGRVWPACSRRRGHSAS